MHFCRLFLAALFLLTVCSLVLETSATQIEENEHEKSKRYDEARMKKEKNEISKDEKHQGRTCPTCGKEDLTDEEAKLLRIEMFKQTLIKALRLDPNNLHTNASDGKTFNSDILKLPPSLTSHMQQDVPVNDNFYTVTIIPGIYMGHDCKGKHATGCATFDLRNKIPGNISGAELWLYKMEDRNDIAGQILDVYEFNKTSGDPLKMKSLVFRKQFFVKEGWLNMDVTGTVRKWLEEGRDNPILAFNCTTCKTGSYKALYGIKRDYKPLLIVKFAREYRTHDKRQAECDPTINCCQTRLEITFSEIGMGFYVLSPSSVNIGYCKGPCSYVDPRNTDRMSLMQSFHLYKSHRAQQLNLSPCCAPTAGGMQDFFLLVRRETGRATYQEQILVRSLLVTHCDCA